MSGNDLAAERTEKGRLGVAVLVPCYNEKRAIAKVIADFGAVMAHARVQACVYGG
jgi:hypothetical protein